MPTPGPRWNEIKALFEAAIQRAPVEREALIAAAALDDAALIELHSLLAHHDQITGGHDFLEAPATTSAPAKPASVAGQRLGAWEVVCLLGSGGMGEVFEARRADGSYEGRAAVKLLKRGMDSAAVLQRFALERQALARLNHPHIARLLDAGHMSTGRGPAQPYLVLEYVPGEPIDVYCQARALTVPQRLRLFLDVLDAVAHAHNRLILHRDLKPSNILVTAAGEVKLLDFGIAKLLDATHPGELTQQAGNAFTPQYAAPEQLQGGDVTTATDVYALGVLLFRLLSGRLPLEGEAGDTVTQWRATLEREPPAL